MTRSAPARKTTVTSVHPDLEDLVNLGGSAAGYLFACSEHRQGRFLSQRG